MAIRQGERRLRLFHGRAQIIERFQAFGGRERAPILLPGEDKRGGGLEQTKGNKACQCSQRRRCARRRSGKETGDEAGRTGKGEYGGIHQRQSGKAALAGDPAIARRIEAGKHCLFSAIGLELGHARDQVSGL